MPICALPSLIDPSAQSFFEATDSFRSPVFLPGGGKDWTAIKMWSPEYLRRRFAGKNADVCRLIQGVLTADAYGGVKAHQQTMEVGEFIDSLDNTTTPHITHYWRQPFAEGPFQGLFDDVIPPQVIDVKRITGRTLWVSAKGIRTAMHFDSGDNIFTQIYGHKHFRLFAPEDNPYLGVDPAVRSGGSSLIDPFAPDLERFPEFVKATPFDVMVMPGDQLFIPAGWWHYVVSETTSISANFWYQSAMAMALRMMTLSRKKAAQG